MGGTDHELLSALLDSWDRNNTILVHLLRAIPEDKLNIRPMETSASIAAQFAHLHFVRLIFVEEDAPEFATPLPTNEWDAGFDREQLAQLLSESARTVREAVTNRITTGVPMNMHYDHPLLFLQHMIWHEGYHHGQIKLALKLAGCAVDDRAVGPLTWGVWMKKIQEL